MTLPAVPTPTYYPDAPGPGPVNVPPAPATVDASYEIVDFPPPPPSSPLQFQTSPYLVAAAKVMTITDPGLYANAVMGPAGTPVDIGRSHAGQSWKGIIFRFVRLGAKPALPSSNTQNANEVPAFKAVNEDATQYLPDGTPIYSVSGFYAYYLRKGPAETDTITGVGSPLAPLQPLPTIAPADYSAALSGPSASPAGAPTDVLTF